MISVYLHIPFCKQKCNYCSFYSLTDFDKEEYISAIIRCVEYWGKKTKQKADTVYIGGGTPSVLPPKLICRLLESVYDNFTVESGAEITIEANPESCDKEFLTAARSCGINRLSLGIQSFCDTELAAAGRLHTAADARQAVSRARELGFDNISCDLIFGLPLQTCDSFCHSIDTLVGLDIEHISCYNLQVEDGTPFARSKISLPCESEQEKMYYLACNILESAGYSHYEISNYAKPGFESRHNSAYWTGKDYLGLGPAAHSKIADTRYSYAADACGFVSKTDFEFDTAEKIEDAFFEKIMLSLRTSKGLELSRLCRSGEFINRLCKEGLAKTENGVLRLTDRGFYLSNSIITDISLLEENSN